MYGFDFALLYAMEKIPGRLSNRISKLPGSLLSNIIRKFGVQNQQGFVASHQKYLEEKWLVNHGGKIQGLARELILNDELRSSYRAGVWRFFSGEFFYWHAIVRFLIRNQEARPGFQFTKVPGIPSSRLPWGDSG